MILPTLLFGFLLVPMFWVMFHAHDAWPFSHYPMFARRVSLDDVEVFRVALETQAGNVVWWRSEFYRYPEYVGLQLKRIHYVEVAGGKVGALAGLERQYYLGEVLRLIESEAGNIDSYKNLHIVRRTVKAGAGPTIEDRTVFTITVAELKRIHRAS